LDMSIRFDLIIQFLFQLANFAFWIYFNFHVAFFIKVAWRPIF
jgi:hypothetical protein